VAKSKISIVKYLNAIPLAWGILEGSQKENFDPILSTPAECADDLSRGSVDVGLIPAIEYHRIKGSRIVPGPVVASTHRVRSVILVSVLPLWKVKTVAFDKGSRTSVALARIIFNDFYKIRPDFRPSDPDIASMLGTSDAALLIGDNALRFTESHRLPNAELQKDLLRHGSEPLQVFDLMERWKFLTGLPFVFAFWATREGFNDPSVVNHLKASRDFGVASLTTIAEKYAEQLSLPKDSLEKYLRENVYYYMDSRCLEGLSLFYEKAAAAGAIKTQRALDFL
jgi:chorismate dehydratase